MCAVTWFAFLASGRVVALRPTPDVRQGPFRTLHENVLLAGQNDSEVTHWWRWASLCWGTGSEAARRAA